MADALADLLIDQESSWQAGTKVPIEHLVARLPAESQSEDNLLALICNEVCLRIRNGDRPNLSEYQSRFPHLSEQLAIQWQVDQWLVDGFSTSLLSGVNGSFLTATPVDATELSTASMQLAHQQSSPEELNEKLKQHLQAHIERAKNQKAPDELAQHARYRLIRQIGRGGMGTVWLAMHIVMNRPVALKVIRPDLLSKAGAVARFRREVQAAAKLHHPNVVTAYDAEQVGNTHFLVVEYIEGQTLASQVAKGPLTIQAACQAAHDAALGLAHAHKSGLVHRDVKPGNLIRDSTGIIKVLDFGLVVDPTDDSSITGENMVMGTPDYVAPEQALKPSEADVRSDIYSLGCTLYHLLSGKAPFSGLTLLAKLDAHRYSEPKPIPGIPPKLQAIVTKMMAKRPDDRFQSADEVLKVLQPFCSDQVIEPPGAAPPAVNAKRRRYLLTAGGAALALGLGESVRRYTRPMWDEVARLKMVFDTPEQRKVPPPPASDPQTETIPGFTRHQLSTPTSMGDGDATDYDLEGQLIRLKANQIWQVWMNYASFPTNQMVVRANVRFVEAIGDSVFKLIFMTERVGDYALQILPRYLDVQLVEQRLGVKTKHLQVDELNKNLREKWTTIELAMDVEKLMAKVDGIQLQGPYQTGHNYHVAMAVQNCVAEVFDLRVFVKSDAG